MKKIVSLIVVVFLTLGLCLNCNKNPGSEVSTIDLGEVQNVKNVILLIGDGMGPEHIRAGELYKKEKLYMQGFPCKVEVDTTALDGVITDSAAASTAMSTGNLTLTGYVGKTYTGEDLETIVDIAHSKGKRTGIITTEEMYGATPMGFSGHSLSRLNAEELIMSAATTSNVNLFASYSIEENYQQIFTSNGYAKIENVDDISLSKEDKVFGSYNISATAESMSANSLSVAFNRLVEESLDYLAQDEDGFFLMAEGAHIDHGGHSRDIFYMLRELVAFDDAVKVAVEWASKRDDTVVLVTADHETGGLELYDTITAENMFDTDEIGIFKHFNWALSSHSSRRVNFYVNGANIDFTPYYVSGNEYIKNISIFSIINELLNN